MPNWAKDEIEKVLHDRGWYKSQKPINHGTQYRLTDDTPIDFYDKSGNVVVKGKETSLKREAEAFFKNASVTTISTPSDSKTVFQLPNTQVGHTQLGSSHPSRVFIVYGHDVTAREQLELFLRRLKLEPVVLQNLTGGGDTIIENLDFLTNADFACVLLTPDDEGRLRDGKQPLKPRARQNVVLELGMVLSKLGRRRVAILVKDVKDNPIERPTDIEGIIYIPFENHVNEITNKLATRLEEAGFIIKVADLVG